MMLIHTLQTISNAKKLPPDDWIFEIFIYVKNGILNKLINNITVKITIIGLCAFIELNTKFIINVPKIPAANATYPTIWAYSKLRSFIKMYWTPVESAIHIPIKLDVAVEILGSIFIWIKMGPMSSAAAMPRAPDRAPVMKMMMAKRWKPSRVQVNGRGCPFLITMSCSSRVRANAKLTSI